jgi:hypothetical protein
MVGALIVISQVLRSNQHGLRKEVVPMRVKTTLKMGSGIDGDPLTIKIFKP